MRDINFFSVYKVARARTKDITLIAVLGAVVLAGLIVGGVLLVNQSFAAIQAQIDASKAFIASEETTAQRAEVAQAKKAAELSEKYLTGLNSAKEEIDASTRITTALLDAIVVRIPATVTLTTWTINGNIVDFDCLTQVPTDPMDMAHSLETSELFDSVYLSDILNDPAGNTSFTITCTLKGGDPA